MFIPSVCRTMVSKFTDSSIFVSMDQPKQISSVHNPLIKKMLALKEKSRERRKSGLFVLEGRREFRLAIKGGYVVDTLFVCTDILSENELLELTKGLSPTFDTVKISGQVYQKIAYRTTTEGILALAKAKSHFLAGLHLQNKTPLLLIAEAPEKPGNIGALLRTADAAGIDAVIIANPNGDLYNPNIIRSSVGCLFTTTIATGTTTEVISYLKKNNIKIYCAALTASKIYIENDFSIACAIVVGTESTGLTEEWLNNSDQNIIIPMKGEIDSMNVSVSAAILIFEATRQRDF